MAESAQWTCPLRDCAWTYFGSADACRLALLDGGAIRIHIDDHDILEYVQALLDAGRAPTVAASVVRRRTHGGTLTYLADKLAEADADRSTTKGAETVRAVELALRVLAMEAADA
jgi:hypothetical protein